MFLFSAGRLWITQAMWHNFGSYLTPILWCIYVHRILNVPVHHHTYVFPTYVMKLFVSIPCVPYESSFNFAVSSYNR